MTDEVRQLRLADAMTGLESGHTVWVRPQGYRGWWVCFRDHSLYEYSNGAWYRCKKGVSTILGGDWFTGNPLRPDEEPPLIRRAHYETDASLAYERRAVNSGEAAILAEFQAVRAEIAELREQIHTIRFPVE